MSFLRYFLVVLILAVVGVVSILGFRGQTFTKPPLEVFPDMDRQPRYKPQQPNAFFEDNRADRPVPEGTMPFITHNNVVYPFTRPSDYFRENDYLVTGKQGDAWGRGFPVSVNYEFMELGREKYDIFCTACHGLSGDGNGITKSYGMGATANLLSDAFRIREEGELYNTITNGKGQMLGYGSKLGVEERWAVIAYLRALQRAANATLEDVPTAKRKELGL